jgi:hypothetical protein
MSQGVNWRTVKLDPDAMSREDRAHFEAFVSGVAALVLKYGRQVQSPGRPGGALAKMITPAQTIGPISVA